MSLQTKIKKTPQCAIFARNYSFHLDEATQQELTTFRSKTIWRSAQDAVDIHGPRKIYFAPVDSKGLIEYEAILEEVELYPENNTDATKRLLANCSPSTQDEGLWEKDGKNHVYTLYVISNCRKVSSPFPITQLKKLSDDKPIDEGFNYSYSIVYEKGMS